MSLHTFGTEHDSKRKVHAFKDRSLLDVQLQISGCIAAFSASVTDPVDVDATVPQSILQTNSIAVGTDTIHVDRLSSSERRRAEEATAEARTLLIGPIDQPNRDWRPPMRFLRETTQYLKAGKNAQAAVQPTAVRYRIEMTPHNKRAFGIASKRRPGVARGIEVMFYRQALQLALKPIARLEPNRTPGETLCAKVIGRQGTKLLEI
jgi:hypothetical protein